MGALLRSLGAETTARESAMLALLVVIATLLATTLLILAYAIVLRLRHQARERRRAQLAERWQGPVLQAVADPAGAGEVRALVDEDRELSFVGFVLGYARRVRGEEKRHLAQLVLPYLDRIEEQVGSQRVEVRARAIQTLGTLGLPEHAPSVVAALDDPSALVAMVAARALARKESSQFAAEVLGRLARFEGWNRRFLASMLAAMGPSVSEALRTGFADPAAAPWVRAALADALLIQGDFLAGDVAARVMETSEDRELLASALHLLCEVGRPEHLAAIRPLCASGDSVIRAQALRAVGSLGGEEEIPLLVSAMSDSFPWAALYAARGVKDAGGREVLAELAASHRPEAGLAGQALMEGEAP
jgi:HEAT repeat protein